MFTYTKIKNIDAIEHIKKLKSEGIVVDAVITDPPYNISKENNFKTMGRAGIDFGDWDKNFNQTDWIKEIAPIIKKGGNIIIFNSWRNLGEIAKALEENNFDVKDLIRWIKNNPMPRNTERRYVSDFEFAIWAVKKGAKWTFNKDKDKPYLRPEFKYPIVSPGKDKIHTTQKNLKLMEDIVSIHTNSGDIVFDPFMGSGTTGIACVNLGRGFIGTELDTDIFKATEQRFKDKNDKVY